MIKWLLLNMFTIGTLALGYFFNAQDFAGMIVGAYYTMMIPLIVMVFLILAIRKDKPESDIAKSLKYKDIESMTKTYKIVRMFLTEPIFIYAVYSMGYMKLAIVMFIEVVLTISIKLIAREIIKKERAQK